GPVPIAERSPFPPQRELPSGRNHSHGPSARPVSADDRVSCWGGPAMRAFAVLLLLVGFVFAELHAGWPDDNLILRRGDANHSGAVDAADAAFLAGWLFSGGPEPPCLNEADVNADGAVNLSDTVYLTSWLFQGGPAP